MAKVLAIIKSCKECPRRVHVSAHGYQCGVLATPLRRNESMPAWCPLPDHPATLVAPALKKVADAKAMVALLLRHACEDTATVAALQDGLRRTHAHL